MGARRITAVTLDVGNTLLYCDPSPPVIYSRALARHGAVEPPESVAAVFGTVWAEMQRLTLPGRDRYSSVPGGERAWWGRFLQEVLNRLGHAVPWELLLDDLYADFAQPEIWKVYPEVPQTLAALRTAGCALAVISNWDGRLQQILEMVDLNRFFEVIVVSGLEQVEKPAVEIFERALERLAVPAAVSMHVGDSPREDYEGAARAGMLPVLVDRKGVFAGDSFRRVSGLDEILQLVHRGSS